MSKREIIVFNDVELGGGTATDDFIADNLLINQLQEFLKIKNPIDLVFNGDTFDFLKCPYIKNGKLKYPGKITVDVSRYKINRIYRSHKQVFEALRKFICKKKNRIYFIFGNHDYDLLFPEIQEKIIWLLDAKKNVFFQMNYFNNTVYIEHGQQYDDYYKIPSKIIKKSRTVKILNIPILTSGFTNFFMPVIERHPFMERVNQRKLLVKEYKPVGKVLLVPGLKFICYNLFFAIFKQIYMLNIPNFFSAGKEFLRDLFSKDFEYDIMMYFKKGTLIRKDANVIIFGHIHTYFNALIENKRLIILDTWRDEYHLNETGYIIPKTKRYARIVSVKHGNKITITEFIPKRGVLNFSNVLKNELGYVQKVQNAQHNYTLKDYKIKKEVYTI